MTAYLEWERNKLVITSSIEELDRLLDQLTLQAANSYTFSVDLTLDSGETLSIVVGDIITPVQFYSLTGQPLVVMGLGTWQGEEDQVFVFNYGGSCSEIMKGETIPIADGREAMRRFLATGQRPDTITWEY